MNKLSKGAIVGGTGLVLVVAGAGSLALWNDAATVDAGAVASGEMTITATDGAWAPAITLWVPGDTSTYTSDLTVQLAGDNLASELAIDPSTITGDADLLAALDVTLAVGAVTGGGTVTPVAGQENTFTVASTTPSAPTTLTIPVTVTVDFPEDSVTDLIAQNESVDLSTLSFTLTQLAP